MGTMNRSAAWREGRDLIAPRDGETPDRCVCCGSPGVRKVLVTIALSKLAEASRPGRVLAAFYAINPNGAPQRHRAGVWIYLCQRHWWRRWIPVMLTFFGGNLVCLLAMLVVLDLLNRGAFSLIVSLAFIVVIMLLMLCANATACWLLIRPPVRVVSMDERSVRLRGAGDAFLDRLPSGSSAGC